MVLPQYAEIIDLTHDVYPIIGLGCVDQYQQLKEYGKFSGKSEWVHGQIQDFNGQVNVPGHGRTMHFPTNEGPGYNVIGVDTEMDDYRYEVNKLYSAASPGTVSQQCLHVKIIHKPFSGDSLMKNWDKWKKCQLKISGSTEPFTVTAKDNGDYEVRYPQDYPAESCSKMTSYMQERYCDKLYLQDK